MVTIKCPSLSAYDRVGEGHTPAQLLSFEVGCEIISFIRDMHAWPLSFCTVEASGRNDSRPHLHDTYFVLPSCGVVLCARHQESARCADEFAAR